MERDDERMQRIVEALRDAGLSALVCTLPENVLLLSGYWPVVGTAVAIATADGRSAVLAPEDESDLARCGWAGEVRTYAPGSLKSLAPPAEAMCAPLAELLRDLGVAQGELGFEEAPIYQGSSYAAMYLMRENIDAILEDAASGATIRSAVEPIARLRSALTQREVGRVRLACRIAGDAFCSAAQSVRPGVREPGVAQAFAAPM